MTALETMTDRLVAAAAGLGARGALARIRTFVAGVLWVLRTGAPWRELPSLFGRWNSVYRRFRRWAVSGRWARVLDAVRRHAERSPEVLLIDSTVVKAHPDAAGAKGSHAATEALGRSRGGFTTKLHALVSTKGRWVACRVTPGQRSDIREATALLESVEGAEAVVGDRAYDSDRLVAWLADRRTPAVIPSRRRRRHPRDLDVKRYADRNVIERFFGRLKRLRRVGTRYDKTVRSFGVFVGLGAAIVERTAWT